MNIAFLKTKSFFIKGIFISLIAFFLIGSQTFFNINRNQKIEAETVNFPWEGGQSFIGNAVNIPYAYNTTLSNSGSTITVVSIPSTNSLVAYKMDKNGNHLWPTDGIEVFNAADIGESISTSSEKDYGEPISDGNGGAYIAFRATIESGDRTMVFLQHILNDGSLAWTDGPVSVGYTDDTAYQVYGRISSDNNGGVYYAWSEDYDSDSNCGLRIQRINSEGQLLFGANGIEVGSSTALCSAASELITYQDGSVLASWKDFVTSMFKAQRVDLNGNILWTSGGIDVLSHSGGSYHYLLAAQSGDDVYLAGSQGSQKIARIEATGNIPWTTSGFTANNSIVSFLTGNANTLAPIAIDSQNNIYIFGGASGSGSILVQKIDSDKNDLWDSLVSIPAIGGSVSTSLAGVTTDDDDLILSWIDNNRHMISTNKVDKDGNVVWETNRSSITSGYFMVGMLDSGPDEALTIASTVASGYPIYINKISTGYMVNNLNNALEAYNNKNETLTNTSTNGVYRNGIVTLKQKSNDKTLALIKLNTLNDMNWSTISAEIDTINARTFANITGAEGVSSYSLIIPIKSSSHDSIILCPAASSINEVSSDCTNKILIHEGETKTVSSNNVTLSRTNIDDTFYWYLTGISQGGAISNDDPDAEPTTTIVTVTKTNNIIVSSIPVNGPDKDNDGLSDSDEALKGTDPNKADTDGDGLKDGFEVYFSGREYSSTEMNPKKKDSNNNGTSDLLEDFDEDGLTNAQEQENGTDPRDKDSDSDTLEDGFEVKYTASSKKDLLDPLDSDSNDNNLKDGKEDFDKDGLINSSENEYSSNPSKNDTDGDKLYDGEEVLGCIFEKNTTSCSDKKFTPSDPTKLDTDLDGLTDFEEATQDFGDLERDNEEFLSGNFKNSNKGSNTALISSILVIGLLLASFGYSKIKNRSQ